MPDQDLVPRQRARTLSERELLLAAVLCFDLDDSPVAIERLKRQIRSRAAIWPQLVDFANKELLAPTLWAALARKGVTGEVPTDSAGRLHRAHALNCIRNERIRSELAEVLRCLNAVGIVPVLLKGAVDLHISRYSDPAARVLRDLDLLVPKIDHPRAVDALVALGYRVKEREAGWLTYSNDLVRKGAMMPVDLQWFISGQRDILSPGDALADAGTHCVGDVQFRVPSAEHQIVHNLLHSELQDHGSGVGFIWLRQLLDFAALCLLHQHTVDWARVHDCFARRGLERVPVARLYMANRLLGLPLPPGIRPTLAARLHYVRCLTLLRWRWSMGLARFAATILSSLDARLLDVIYGIGGGRGELARVRVKHSLRLLGHYGGNLPQVIRNRRKKFT
ncbi:MAG: nucleotidyltransferase family protein [Steroidobacteraceae bacterium]|nr:nucleotidyltransferase family protein [Steroidobacteraceae bacterium]MBP7014277.1 nucleotidyltransferase family protein [Steroidobacteraceae bacterium]